MGNPLIEDSIYQHYLDWTIQDQDDLDFFQPFVELNTDEAFSAPTDIAARAHSMAGDPVFLYQVRTEVLFVSLLYLAQIILLHLCISHHNKIYFKSSTNTEAHTRRVC